MQILKNHGLNITSLRVLLKAVENSVDLMAITVKYDDGTVRQVYKIAAHRISVNPVSPGTTTVGMATAGLA